MTTTKTRPAPASPAVVHMLDENVAFLAELVDRERREALDADDADTAERCTRILNSLNFALHATA